MKEQLSQTGTRFKEFWQTRTKNQKSLMIGTLILIVIIAAAISWAGSRTHYVPLYTNMTMQEAGEVKATLDGRGIANEVSADGTVVSVPDRMVDDLKVSLAAEGIPRTGRIDYSTFSENMGFGTTENEFQLLERAALQTSLEDLIRNIDGISQAQVMITMPEESPWLAEEDGASTASVMVNVQPGASLDEAQIRSLYHLVSQSVPNLAVEDVVITDQMSRHLEFDSQDGSSTGTAYEQNRAVQRDIERDIQRELQQMLATIMGPNKAVVSVSTDIDFTQENRQEELVEPVDEDLNEGIAISVERITDIYEGLDPEDGGVPGTDEDDVPGFPGFAGGGAYGDSERIEERINNEVNRISRDIVESPYKIRDLGIQVMVEPPDPEDMNSLPQAQLNDIQALVSQIIRTSVDSEMTAEWDELDIEERVLVSAMPFHGAPEMEEPGGGLSLWMIVSVLLVLIVALLIFLLVRKSRDTDDVEETGFIQEEYELPPLEEREDESTTRRKQLEKLAREKPDQFSKLIRSWLSED
ncbi:flagellar basal-body MS-ring/collar protein FliF [Bacillus daqingensis]|uniref:Flagellar M-ring protein n=1 Tax=Bacillus daqingensis TaxID=872396 RepID=A0ABV9NTQ6_9BACI